jgi:hypothetical protein
MKVTANRRTAEGVGWLASPAAGPPKPEGLPHGAAKATEAAAPEATEAATAASRRIAGTPKHGYERTREARWPPSRTAGGGRRDGLDGFTITTFRR